jgi:ubiquinone/menaquinone biosynthesis C-methylase UbiE
VIYQHPLAYLLGLQGVALLRAYNGEYDREFTEARIAEIRAMLDRATEFGDGATVGPITATEGYDVWAAFYDGPNDLIDLEEPVIRPIIDRLPIGLALDAACGTGRHTAYLAAKGHSVIGVDGSAKMLAVAKAKVPGADFCQGDLRALPVADQQVDLVTISLALSHVPELAPVLAEFSRVLRPGGHLVISDSRMDYPMVLAMPDGSHGYMPHQSRSTSEYLAAALPLGFEVRRCEELRFPQRDPATAPQPERVLPAHPSDIWTLRAWYPAAAYAAYNGSPMLIFWDFELSPIRLAGLAASRGRTDQRNVVW